MKEKFMLPAMIIITTMFLFTASTDKGKGDLLRLRDGSCQTAMYNHHGEGTGKGDLLRLRDGSCLS